MLRNSIYAYVIKVYAFIHGRYGDTHSNAARNMSQTTPRLFRKVLDLTEKDLKKLNRYQLLELLIVQTDRAENLQAKLDAAETQLANQELQISSLGSIAEASLQLKGVFQAAQDAADMYIDAAKKRADEIEEAAHKKAAGILAQAQAQARRLKGEG